MWHASMSIRFLFAVLSILSVAFSTNVEDALQNRQAVGGIVVSGVGGTGGLGGSTTPTTAPSSLDNSSTTTGGSVSSTVVDSQVSTSSTPVSTSSSSSSKSSSVVTSSHTSTAATPTVKTSTFTSSATKQVLTTVIITSGSTTLASVFTTSALVPVATGTATTTQAAGLGSGDSSGSPGLTSSQKNIIIGVVVGVCGAILLGGLVIVAWRIWGRKRHADDDDDLTRVGTPSGREKLSSNSNSPFKSTLDQYHTPANVNTASNF